VGTVAIAIPTAAPAAPATTTPTTNTNVGVKRGVVVVDDFPLLFRQILDTSNDHHPTLVLHQGTVQFFFFPLVQQQPMQRRGAVLAVLQS